MEADESIVTSQSEDFLLASRLRNKKVYSKSQSMVSSVTTSDMQEERTHKERKDSTYENPNSGVLRGVTKASYENQTVESLGHTIITMAGEIEEARQRSTNIQGNINGLFKRNAKEIEKEITAPIG